MPRPFEIKNLYDAKDYESVITFWANEEEHPSFTEYDYFYIMESAYRLQTYDMCLNIYQEFVTRFPNSHRLDMREGWAIYQTEIKTFNEKESDPQNLINSLEKILQFGKSKYSAHIKSILKACESLLKSRPVNPKQANNCQIVCDYLDQLDPDELGTDAYNTVVEKKNITLPSDRETWYSLKSKALNRLHNYQECITCIDSAFKTVSKFHTNIDIWLNNRKASCLIELDQLDEAEKILSSIKDKSHHWKVEQTIFNLDLKRNRIDSARQHAANCSLCDKNHSSRINFYRVYSTFLEMLGLAEEAQYLWRFIQILRKENNWNLRQDERDRYIAREILLLERDQVLDKLNRFWNSECPHKERFTGTMRRKINDVSGLIEPDSKPGTQLYFYIKSISGNRKLPQIGQRMSFEIENILDKKHNVMKPNAVNIKLIGE